MADPNLVMGFIKLPWYRHIGCKVAYPLMQLGVPGAGWCYFRCLFGLGVSFTTHNVDMCCQQQQGCRMVKVLDSYHSAYNPLRFSVRHHEGRTELLFPGLDDVIIVPEGAAMDFHVDVTSPTRGPNIGIVRFQAIRDPHPRSVLDVAANPVQDSD